MPTYDPALRTDTNPPPPNPPKNGTAIGSTGGTSSAPVPKVNTTVDGDLILVFANVGNGPTINAPDATWTRVTSITSAYQAFWKRASGEPSTWTFTWDGIQRAYIFTSFSLYSQAGGTVSLDTAAITSIVGLDTKITSAAVTPSQNALVLVDYIEFVISEPGPPSGPGALAPQLLRGGFGFPSVWAGDIGIPAGTSSGTYLCSNSSGDPNSPFNWGAATFAIISSFANPILPPFIDDEIVFIPTISGAATSKNITVPFIDDELVFAPTLPFQPPAIGARRPKLQVINAGGSFVQGSVRVVRVQLTDWSGVYVTDRPATGTPIPLGPPAGVLISLISTSGRTIVNQAPMSPDPNITGNFFYVYKSVPNDETGRWLAQFSFFDGVGDFGVAAPRPIWTVTTQ